MPVVAMVASQATAPRSLVVCSLSYHPRALFASLVTLRPHFRLTDTTMTQSPFSQTIADFVQGHRAFKGTTRHVVLSLICSRALNLFLFIIMALVCLRTTSSFAATSVPIAWGRGNYGQLGTGSMTDNPFPAAVDTSGILAGKTIVAVSTGNLHCLALANDGTAYAWGSNYWGQLGNSSIPE